MTQLTENELEAIREFKADLEASVKHTDAILDNKYFPEKAEDEVGYLITDFTNLHGGHRNENIMNVLQIINSLRERLEEPTQ